MKTSFFSILVGSAVFLAPQIASATLLVGFDNFDGTVNTENASYNLSGFSGKAIDGTGQASYDTGGSNDGTLGSSTFTEFTPTANNGYLRSFQGGDPIIQVTNNTTQAYGLTSLLFDAANQSGGNKVAVSYHMGTSGAWVPLFTTPSLPNAGDAGDSANYADFLQNLIGLNLTLLGGVGTTATNTIQFKFDGQTNGRIDNIALTGLRAVPEPASVLALGCLLGSGLFLRNRRRMTPISMA